MKMTESTLKDLDIHIHFIMDKKTHRGWTDIRQNVEVHSFYWIGEGRGSFRIEDGEGNNEQLAVKSGMLLYLRPGIRLLMETDAELPLRITMLLLSISKTIWHKHELGSTALAGALPLPFVSEWSGAEAADLDNRFRKLFDNWAPGQSESDLLTKASVYLLLNHLHQAGRRVERSSGNRDAELFEAIKDKLARSYGNKLRLSRLAEEFQISETYMRQLFHRYQHQSPKSYLNELRNEHAKRQLLYTDHMMKEIAETCGYADEFHFSKSFKRLNGLPPKVWRESLER
ncbi:AraC family transcriptional regulator [Paenibacillus sp. HB172176]|uniref:helix-turn-helix transcriptional regulator n=1 Tax=Paenibacillus sp. HB172176 TaxID=2493690 RepID=UPI00143BE8CA|nr:AraC family transcriptional regulator [Paenibacillus sp. HB172176]